MDVQESQWYVNLVPFGYTNDWVIWYFLVVWGFFFLCKKEKKRKENFQADFRSSCTDLHSHQQCANAALCTSLLRSGLVHFVDGSHADWGETES